MTQSFQTPPINIASVIEILLPYSFSLEMMNSFNWDKNNCPEEDEIIFDISMSIVLLGGQLYDKSSFNELN